MPLLSFCAGSRGPRPATPATPGDAQAVALLVQIAEDLLLLFPEAATSLGIDTGSRAALRSHLGDRSAEGVQRAASQVRTALERINPLTTADQIGRAHV